MRAQMEIPPGPYISPFENPEKLYPRWSPFASKENFNWQLTIMRRHASGLLGFLSIMAPPHVIPALIVLSLALLVFRSQQRWKIVWFVLTLVLFLAPFLFVLLTYRYLIPHTIPLALLLCMMVVLEWRRAPRTTDAGAAAEARHSTMLQWPRALAAVLVCASFGWGGYVWMKPILARRASSVYRTTAQKIVQSGLKGPFACEDRARASEIAYHSGHKYVGFPDTKDPQEATNRLGKLGVEYLVILDSHAGLRAIAPLMLERGGWRQAIRVRGITVYRYDPAAPPTTRPAATDTMEPDDEPDEEMEPEGDEKPPATRPHAPPVKKKKPRSAQ